MTQFSERQIKATRKPAKCSACETPVAIGSAAIRWTGLNDGEFCSVIYHPDCRAAEIELNRNAGLSGCDWLQLRYAVEEEPDDLVWLRAEHPTVASRLDA